MSLLDEAGAILPELVDIRRRIHRRPEVGLDTPATQATISEMLGRLGLEPRPGRSISSVTAVIGPERPGRTVVLRADTDALPLTEATGLEFASETPGRMHACGHDLHAAMLLGAARLLRDRHRADPEALPGPVLLMFQPGEEAFFGARVMLDEGLLDGVDTETATAFSIHVSTRYPAGEVHLRPGTLLASADNFLLTVRGRGGHASTPHLAADPIPVAAEIVLALQSAVTRSTDALDPVVLTIGRVNAGTTHNVIPEVAVLEGTYRCVSESRRAEMPGLIRRVVEGVSTAHGLEGDARIDEIYPVTVNDPRCIDRVRAVAADLVGADAVHAMPVPLMTADDWSFVLQRVPGAYAFLGARPRHREFAGYPQNHSNLVVFDEAAMAVGAALYAQVALEL